MVQLHRRFSDDQVDVLLNGYCQGLLRRAEGQEMLGIGKTRSFPLLQEYPNASEALSVPYQRHITGRLPAAVEIEIAPGLVYPEAAALPHRHLRNLRNLWIHPDLPRLAQGRRPWYTCRPATLRRQGAGGPCPSSPLRNSLSQSRPAASRISTRGGRRLLHRP